MADLVEVLFEPAGKRVWVQPGATILAAAEAAGIEIATGCTRGMCGTDAVEVTSGGAGLAEPTEDEKGTLERMGLPAEFRLSCSAVLAGGAVTVRIDSF